MFKPQYTPLALIIGTLISPMTLANEITGVEKVTDSIVFHAGAKYQDGKIVTSGGRVMAVTSYGNTYNEAIKKSYQSIENLHFDKMNYRKDIGFDL